MLIELGEFFRHNMSIFLLSIVIVIAFLALLELFAVPNQPYIENSGVFENSDNDNRMMVDSQCQSSNLFNCRNDAFEGFTQEVIYNYFNYIKNEIRNNYHLIGLSNFEIIKLLTENGVNAEVAENVILPKVCEMFHNDHEMKGIVEQLNDYDNPYVQRELVWKFIGDTD